MALEKVVEVDQIEVKGEYSIQVRTATKVMDDGQQIGSVGYHRHVVHPDSILSSEDAKVKKIAEALWGDTEKEAYYVSKNGHPSGEPADSWTVAQLQKYLSNYSVEHKKDDAKSALLIKAKAKYAELNS
tara:strand:- start:174 stop:560 length:387 start_codon:yes stop_codon:yes gene_type:complete